MVLMTDRDSSRVLEWYDADMIDWSSCPAVERDPERVSGAWVFRGTHVPVAALFENLEDGALATKEHVHGEPGGEISVRPWGERSFYAEDPWGNPLCFVQTVTTYPG